MSGNHFPLTTAEMGSSDTISLYFHIPFCSRKCDYCHFYVLPDKESYKVQFMEGLKLDWHRWAKNLGGKTLHSLYFGGGTPTLLGPERIQTILSWVKEAGLKPTHEIEVTIEANPEEISRSLIQPYAEMGINRISIGIQSLDDDLLKILSRQHSADKAFEAVWIAKEAGITNISVDLMYDLPKQRLSSWESTLKRVKDLPITHLSLYNLTIEPHTVFFKRRESLKKDIPQEEESLAMYEMALNQLEEVGLEQYEISAFHRCNKYSRHNVGYWVGRPFIGFGPSAFSYWEGKRFRNAANLSKYTNQLKLGESPVDFEECLDDNARVRELLAIQLRLKEGIDIPQFESRHGELDLPLKEMLNQLQNQGLVHFCPPHLALTRKGMLFYDTVASEIV